MNRKQSNFLLLLLLLPSFLLWGHEIRPAYLEIKQTTTNDYEVIWKVPLVNQMIPKIYPLLPAGFEMTEIYNETSEDALIRKYKANYATKLGGETIGIEQLEVTLIDVLVQINLLEDVAYTLLLQPDKPVEMIPSEPNKREVIKLYIQLGIEHILIGIDHLLFVLGLLLLLSNFAALLKTITAFTVAHSLTLAGAAMNIISLPQKPVEAIIALSILFLAREYLSYRKGKEGLTQKYPWLVAFLFGLLHGFGFAGALSEIGLPQKELLLALFTFNIGVEIGQLMFVLALLVFWKIIGLINYSWPKWSYKILPYAMGSIAAFWLIERVLSF